MSGVFYYDEKFIEFPIIVKAMHSFLGKGLRQRTQNAEGVSLVAFVSTLPIVVEGWVKRPEFQRKVFTFWQIYIIIEGVSEFMIVSVWLTAAYKNRLSFM